VSTQRKFATKRQSIVNGLAEKLKTIDRTGKFLSNLNNNVSPRLKFWDEVEDFPAVHINAGSETREYQTGGVKDRFLSITLRCYVNEEDAVDALAALLEDVEVVIEANSRLAYTDRTGTARTTLQSTIVSIDTDEGVLDPLGVGEILLEVRY